MYVLHSYESYRSARPDDIEEDPAVLERREKQIRYGKSTADYDTYLKVVPRQQREWHMPRTPEKHRKYSRRKWDGLIKAWKKSIHKYGGQPQDAAAAANDISISTSTTLDESSSSERPTKIVGWFWADQVEDAKKEDDSKPSSNKETDSKPREMPLKSYEYKTRFALARKYEPSKFF